MEGPPSSNVPANDQTITTRKKKKRKAEKEEKR